MEAESEQLFGKQLVRKLFLPLLLAVLAYAALLLYGDAAGVIEGIRHVSVSTLLFASLLSIASFALRGLRWETYLRAADIRVPARESALIFLAGLGMSITPGKVGELLKSMLLKEARDVPVAQSAPIVIAERVLDLGALVTLGAMGITWNESPALAIAIGVSGIAAFFAIGKSRRLALFIVGLMTKIPRIARYREKLLTAHNSLYQLWGFSSYAIAMGLSLLAWGLQAYIVVLLAAAFPDTTVSLPHALVSYSAPLLAGSLAFLPGGLGLTEASMAGTLKALSHVSTTVAASLTILVRGVTFWLAVFIGFGALAIWRARGQSQLAARAEPARPE